MRFLSAIFLAFSAPVFAAPPVVEPVDANVVNDASNPIPVTIQTDPVPVAIQGASVPVTVETHTIVLWRLVGPSSHIGDGDFTYDGLRGASAMHAACADAFPGMGARAASIADAYAGGAYSFGGYAFGRLVPSGPMVAYPAGEGWRAVDAASGVFVGIETVVSQARALQAAYCNSYTSTAESDRAPVVRTDGRVTSEGCNFIAPVACVAPTILELP